MSVHKPFCQFVRSNPGTWVYRAVPGDAVHIHILYESGDDTAARLTDVGLCARYTPAAYLGTNSLRFPEILVIVL